MKTLITILFTAVAVVGLLYSEITPWRLVSKADVNAEQKLTPAQPAMTPVVVEKRILVPVQVTPNANHSGDWMRDPNYRTSLEKTTITGAPERARIRDVGGSVATPSH